MFLNYLSVHYPIGIQQLGFQPKKSSVSALVDVIHESTALDNGHEVCAVFFGLQKAFDSVPRKSLMHKLSSIDLDLFVLWWICSYLMYREQYVVLNGERFATCKVTSRVP